MVYIKDGEETVDTIGYCNINSTKYNELASAIDASSTKVKANYDKYYENARDLYNHLQATAYNASFETDGSDLLVMGSSDYTDLLELIPGGTTDDQRASFVTEYGQTAVLTDYYHALLVQQSTEFNSIMIGKTLTVTDENDEELDLTEGTNLHDYFDNDSYTFVTASSAFSLAKI